MKLVNKVTKEILNTRIRNEIQKRSILCFDICAEHDQIFDNVKHMSWFKIALGLELGLLEQEEIKTISYKPG